MKAFFSHISKIICLSLIGLYANNIHAQDWKLVMDILVTEDGKKRAGAQVKLFRDGSLVKTVASDARGNANIVLEPGGIYTIEIGGNSGLVKKKLEVDTKNVPPDELSGEVFFEPQVDIFKKLDGLDYNILNQPIGKIKYDPSYGSFDADLAYTKTMKKKLDELQEQYLEKKAEADKREEQKEELYDEAIKKADKAFKDEQWEEAEKYYKEAESLMPIETYPTFQLAELETKLIKIRETNKKYNDAIAKADAAVASGNLQAAVAEYKRASGYKPEEQYPQDKLKEVQDKLANQAKIEQDYLAAIERGDNASKASDLNTAKASFEEAAKLKPEETYPKNKLAEINDVLAKREAKQKAYDDAIKAADEALAAKDYAKAKADYQKAQGLKPTETYPSEQITKVEELMAAAAKLEQNYLAAIEQGDQALQAKNYDAAITAYEEASKLKAEEEYPKNKIKEIEQIKAAAEAKEKEYKDKIDLADKALSDKDYEGAKKAYQEAASLKPAETYPSEKIKEIDGILADIAQKEKAYQAAIQKGDQALSAENYEAAKTAYQEALTLKADESYPQEKLNEIDGIVVKLQKAEEEYNKAIQDGDDALTDNNLEAAKGFYQKAVELKAEEQYPKDKLAEIKKIETEQAQKEADYQAAITEGDQAFDGKDYEKAKTAYQKALSLKPGESKPQERITEIEGLLADQAEKEANYKAAIDKGDAALAANKLEEAKTAYQNALSIKSTETYPQEKITEIEGLIKAQQEKEANYQAAIKKGDDALGAEDYDAAKAAYQEALSIRDDDYPKSKIAEIDTKLAEIAKAEEQAAKLEADYQAAISEGDQSAQADKLDQAITAYQKASELKPDEDYPKQKLEEIKTLQEKRAAEAAEKARLAKIQASYDSLIKVADAGFNSKDYQLARSNYQAALQLKNEEAYPKEKVEEINGILADAAQQEEAYKAAITEADKLLSEEKWEEAKAKYQEASSIKSEESYPKDKVAEIESKLDELAAIKVKQEKEAELQLKYDGLIAEGDALFKEDKLDEAKAKYEEALGLKSGESYPTEQLAAIENRRAELNAKKQAAQIDAEYQAAISEADQLLASEDYQGAKQKFQEASGLKPNESYPKDKITEIDAKIEELAAQKEAAQIDAEYQAAISEADQLMSSEDYEGAKKKYQEALNVKPNEGYPKDKITEIDTKLTEIAANKEAAQLDAEYQAKIAEADKLFEAKDYEAAKGKYQEALGIKSSESYPKEKIAEIETLVKELAAQKEAAQIDAEYQAAIAAADQFLSAKDYEQAKSKYEEAKQIKSSETYPQEKIDEIDSLVAAQAKEQAAAAQAKKQAQFQSLIAEGDALLDSDDLEGARNKYQEALGVMEDPYPANQIEKIEEQLKKLAEKKAQQAKLEQVEQAYQNAIKEGDDALSQKNYDKALEAYRKASGLKQEVSYPKEQIEKISQLQESLAAEKEITQRQYQAAMNEGETFFSEKAYLDAISSFENAQKIKPGETEPQERIKAAKEALSAIKAKQEEIRLKKEQEAQNQAAYETAINSGDRFFEAKKYNEAENEYRLALGLKSSETYPKEQLDKIAAIRNQKKAAEAKAKQKESQYNELISSGDNAFGKENYQSAKSDYQAALSLKPNESYPAQQLKIIEEKLRQQAQARKEELKKLDEPIKIKEGPKATIDGSAEAKIDAMYKEMWAQKNKDKNELVQKKQELLKELSDEEREKEEQKRLNAIEKIENISISLREQGETSEDFYMQNFETVKEKEQSVKEGEETLSRESEKTRAEVMAEKEQLADNKKDFEQSRNEEIVEGKKKAVEQEVIDLKEAETERHAKQDKRIDELDELVNEKGDAIRTFNQDRTKQQIEGSSATLEETQKKWDETLGEYVEDSESRRNFEMDNLEDKQAAIREFEHEKGNEIIEGKGEEVATKQSDLKERDEEYVEGQTERTGREISDIVQMQEDMREEEKKKQGSSYKPGQEKYEEQTVAVKDYTEAKTEESRDRIMNEQENVNEIAQGQRQMAGDKSGMNEENYAEIEEKTKVLKNTTEELNDSSEARRQKVKEIEYYAGEDKPRQDPESAEYPQGVTEKIIENSNGSTTIRRIVVEGTQTDVYEKTLYPYGDIYYTKNGVNITKEIWDSESK